jgi:alpha-mannosidase
MDLRADAKKLATAWPSLSRDLVARATTPHVAVFIGADHHGVHPDLCRLRDMIAELEPEAEVRISRLDELLERATEASAGVAAVRGELRWSYGYTWTLQGVHGTRAELKRCHSEAELWLSRTAEPLAALASAIRTADHTAVLGSAWRTLLRAQFHDSICGCTSDAVAVRVAARIEDAELTAREVSRLALDALTGNDPDRAREEPSRTTPSLVVWNGAPRTRGGVIVADLTAFLGDVLVGPPGSREPRRGAGFGALGLSGRGGPIPVQVLGRRTAHERMDSAIHYPDQDEVEVARVALRLPDMPGFGIASFGAAGRRVSRPSGRARARDARLDNGLVEATLGRDGRVSMVDRSSGEEFEGLLRFESNGDVGDTYTYAAPRGDAIRTLMSPVRTRVLADGPLVAAIEAVGRMRLANGTVDTRTVISLHDGSRALRATMEVVNQASDHRLRVRLPTGVVGVPAVAGSAFGAVERGVPHADPGRYPRERPVATAPAQRFVACAAGGRGLAVFAPGFFEYELTDAGDLIVTLLRAIGALSRADLPSRPGHAGWPTATPGAQSRGLNRLQLALCPVVATDGSELEAMWEDLFVPPRAVWMRQATGLRLESTGWTLQGEGLAFSALKPAKGGCGVVFRCFNSRHTEVAGVCRASFPLAGASRVRADESSAEPIAVEPDGRSVRFTSAGYEIVTLLLRPALPSSVYQD